MREGFAEVIKPTPKRAWKACVAYLGLLLSAPVAVFANTPPIIDSFAASAAWVAPGGTLTFTVNAHDPDCAGTCASGCGVYLRSDLTQWSSSAGTFPVRNNGTSASPYTASATWQAPATEGTYSVTVTLADSGTSFGCGGRMTATATLNVQVSATPPNLPPTITSLTWDQNPIYPNQTATVTATATDPEGDPVTLSWSVDMGSISSSGATTALYSAPVFPGKATVTCTASDGKGGTGSRTTLLSVTSAMPQGAFTGVLDAPQRVTALSTGDLAVADPRYGGVLTLSGGDGSPLGHFALPGVTAVAADWMDRLLVGTRGGARVVDLQGRLINPLTPPEDLGGVTDAAVDVAGQRYLVLYGQPGRVVAFDAAGAVAAVFGSNGDGPGQFKGASALAVTATGQVLVGDSGHGLIHVFDGAGNHLASFGGVGGNAGQFIQITGLGADSNGLIYASDAFQSWVQVFSPDGTFRETLGGYGTGVGQLMTPAGLTFAGAARTLVVASVNAGSLQLFATASGNQVQPPTVPIPIAPADGAQVVTGTPVLLTVANATDPASRPLQYQFELYALSGGLRTDLGSWTVPEGASGSTEVDVTTESSVPGAYYWHARAYNGQRYSAWTTDQNFSVLATLPPANHPPTAPAIVSPDGQTEVASLTPDLLVANASDADGDLLSYAFQVALVVDGVYTVAAESPAVPEGASLTPWSLPAGVLAESQLVSWRCRAYDGKAYGDWTPYAQFWTPDFALPLDAEVGHIPLGDATRPGQVRASFGAAPAGVTLFFQAYDITSDTELTLEVNGAHIHAIPLQVAGDWSSTVEIALPASELNATAPNRIRLLHPDQTDPWGVRNVSLTPPDNVPRLSATAFNTVVDVGWAVPAGLPSGTLLRLYRADGVGAPFYPLGDGPPALGLRRDTGLANNIPYAYKATYVNAAGVEGPFSKVVTATPLTAHGITPITDLKVAFSGADLLLTWTPVTSDPAIETVEIYSAALGAFTPDTSGFSNQIGVESGTARLHTLPGGAAWSGDVWYSAIPKDLDGTRATP